MGFETAAGAVLACMTAVPASFDASGYGAGTYTAIGEITNAGEFSGKLYNLVTHNPLATRGVKKGKGSFNNGQVSPDLAFDFDDAGQIILEAAANADADATATLTFEMTLQSGHKIYFQGLVMSNPTTRDVNQTVAHSLGGVSPSHPTTQNGKLKCSFLIKKQAKLLKNRRFFTLSGSIQVVKCISLTRTVQTTKQNPSDCGCLA